MRYDITTDRVWQVTRHKEIDVFINTQLYDMARVREQEYLDAADRRQHRAPRNAKLVAGIARRLRRR